MTITDRDAAAEEEEQTYLNINTVNSNSTSQTYPTFPSYQSMEERVDSSSNNNDANIGNTEAASNTTTTAAAAASVSVPSSIDLDLDRTTMNDETISDENAVSEHDMDIEAGRRLSQDDEAVPDVPTQEEEGSYSPDQVGDDDEDSSAIPTNNSNYSFRVIHDDYPISFEDVEIPPIILEDVNQMAPPLPRDINKDDVEVGIADKNYMVSDSDSSPEGESGEDDDDEGDDLFGSSANLQASSNNNSSQFHTSSSSLESSKVKYDWHLYAPSTKHVGQFLRWAMVGGSRFSQEQSDEDLYQSLAGLARCLHLMRDYLYHHGLPERGGHFDQLHVLRQVIRHLYAGGTPLWALEPVMQKAAEGLTGQPNVNWQLYPRKAFLYSPASGTTSMFRMDRGFNISKMSAMEGVVVRLASFASNVEGVSNIPARFPNPQEFQTAARTESVRNFQKKKVLERGKLARKILNLASKQQGLFYYINSREYVGGDKPQPLDDSVSGHHNKSNNNNTPKLRRGLAKHGGMSEDFWVVSDEERELFSRLACQEALRAIDAIDARENDPKRPTSVYTPQLIMLCRIMGSAGACAFWFGGSWQDMIVSGVLAVIVAFIGMSSLFSKQERLVFEVISSFVVGMISGLLALAWPDKMCFSAIAISGILDLLQGFRVVYAIIEIMSRHTVSGGADLLEGILFTGLISYFLQFGSYTAAAIMGKPEETEFTQCNNGLSELWYILIVPLTITAWAIMFTPYPRDLPGMILHGLIGYCTNFALGKANINTDLNYFVSASAISLSAGIFSRFTGRQAVGNTVAGIYTLLPGAYLVSSLYTGDFNSSFFTDIVKTAIVIGIGGWTGTILCSPTLMGTTRGLLWQQSPSLPGLRHSRSNDHTIASAQPHPPPFGGVTVASDNGDNNPHHHRVFSNSMEHNKPFHNHRPTNSFGSGPPPMNGNNGGSHQFQPHHQRIPSHSQGYTNTLHRRKPSSLGSGSAQAHGTGGGHNRYESNVSFFDFEHPTSTMLFF